MANSNEMFQKCTKILNNNVYNIQPVGMVQQATQAKLSSLHLRLGPNGWVPMKHPPRLWDATLGKGCIPKWSIFN